MNAYDILEEQGFLQSLSNTNNRIIYLRINSSNLLRSWIIFYSFCLKNEAIRYRVQRFDYTPLIRRKHHKLSLTEYYWLWQFEEIMFYSFLKIEYLITLIIPIDP